VSASRHVRSILGYWGRRRAFDDLGFGGIVEMDILR
jgi:hypothetical protein